jgi:WD40 repeat protein
MRRVVRLEKLFLVSFVFLLTVSTEAQSGWRTLKHGEASITSVRFTPDGKSLVSASFNGTVVLWNLETGKQAWKHDFDIEGTGVNYTISHILAMELSPDGSTIAASYTHSYIVNNRLKKGDDDRIALLDAKDGRELRLLVGSTARALRFAFSGDGRLLASGGPDGTTRLWEVSTGQEVRAIESPRSISALSFAPDGKLLAVGQASPNSIGLVSAPDLLLFNVDSGELVRKLRVQSSYVIDAAFSHDGGLFAVAGLMPAEVMLLDPRTWQPVKSLKDQQMNTHKISFSPNGRLLAAGEAWKGNGRISVWDTETKENPRSYTLQSGVATISFSPDGTTLAAGTEDGQLMLVQL